MALAWFYSYLTENICDHFSPQFLYHCGVTQGSTMWPNIFLIPPQIASRIFILSYPSLLTHTHSLSVQTIYNLTKSVCSSLSVNAKLVASNFGAIFVKYEENIKIRASRKQRILLQWLHTACLYVLGLILRFLLNYNLKVFISLFYNNRLRTQYSS